MFMVSYLLKGGILDGTGGFRLARSRFDYYAMIRNLEKDSA